jgi:2-dehydropantoate 2-reductase
MRIAIFGCGAMGTIIGAYLTKNGCPVDMIDANAAHVGAMNGKGAHIIGSVNMTVPVKALLPEQMEGVYDLVFLLTKQTANGVVLAKLKKHLAADGTVCTLQNGVPEPGVASQIGAARTVGGAIHWGATYIGPGVSELTQDVTKNSHLFEIGEIDGAVGPRIQGVARVLEHMGPVHVTDSLIASRWGKLLCNACMSGMSAACGSVFDSILENDKARACLSYIGHEVKLCCEAAGYRLPTLMGENSPDSLDIKDQAMFDENQRMFINMYDGLRAAKASMLQDLEKGLQSEVAMINGFVRDTGDRHAVDTPFNDTVVDIVQKIEKKELPLSMDNLRRFDAGLFRFRDYHPQRTAAE